MKMIITIDTEKNHSKINALIEALKCDFNLEETGDKVGNDFIERNFIEKKGNSEKICKSKHANHEGSIILVQSGGIALGESKNIYIAEGEIVKVCNQIKNR